MTVLGEWNSQAVNRVEAIYAAPTGYSVWDQNPAVRAVLHYQAEKDLQSQLFHDPFTPGLKNLPSHLRKAAADFLMKQAFVPTDDSCTCIERWNEMRLGGLTGRNPGDRGTWRVINSHSLKGAERLPLVSFNSGPGDGFSLRGATGFAKTHIISRFRSLTPQVIFHRNPENTDLVQFVQLPYLCAELDYAGSLGGILFNILTAFDEALGTSFWQEYTKSRLTVPQLLNRVIHLLRSAFTGILFLEELQKANTVAGRAALEIEGFFLLLMNAGIPVVFSGAPFGFDIFTDSAQDTSRASSAGFRDLMPFERNDPEALQSYLPKMLKMTVLRQTTRATPGIATAIWDASAFVPRYISRALVNGMKVALEMGSESLTPEMIELGAQRGLDKRNRELVDAIKGRDIQTLLTFHDISVWDFAKRWKVPAIEVLEIIDPEAARRVAVEVGTETRQQKRTGKRVTAKEESENLEKAAKKATNTYIDRELRKHHQAEARKQALEKKKKANHSKLPATDLRSKNGLSSHIARAYLAAHT